MKLSHALEGFWLSKRLDFSAATVQNYERVFREFLARLGDREMETITSDDIRRYLEYLHKRRRLSKRSVHSHWAILSSLWTWAEWELQIPHIIRGNIPAPGYRKWAIICLMGAASFVVRRLVAIISANACCFTFNVLPPQANVTTLLMPVFHRICRSRAGMKRVSLITFPCSSGDLGVGARLSKVGWADSTE
jgi:hypothetical protein